MPANILIVDDNLFTCQVLIRCLKTIGTKAECAGSGKEALAMMAINIPALVFLDYMMPEMDGLEVLRRMKADPLLQAIPVILFTAHDGDELRKDAIGLGAADVLLKSQTGIEDIRRSVSRQSTQDVN